VAAARRSGRETKMLLVDHYNGEAAPGMSDRRRDVLKLNVALDNLHRLNTFSIMADNDQNVTTFPGSVRSQGGQI